MLVIDAVRPLEKIAIPNINNNILIRKTDITDFIDMEHLFKTMDKHLSSSPRYLLKRD